MRESTRLKIVRVLTTEMGIDPNLLARDGANSDGFYVFVGKKANGERLRRFVTWTAEQRAVIEAHRDLFSEWFNDGVCCCCCCCDNGCCGKFSGTNAAYAEEEM